MRGTDMSDIGNPFAFIVSAFKGPRADAHRKNPRPTSMSQPTAKGYYSAEVILWFKRGKWGERCDVRPLKNGFVAFDAQFCKPTGDGPGLELEIEASYLPGPKKCEIKFVVVSERHGREFCRFRADQLGSAAQPFLIWLAGRRPA